MAVEATTNVTTQPVVTTEAKKADSKEAETTVRPEVKKDETTGTVNVATPKETEGKKLDVVA